MIKGIEQDKSKKIISSVKQSKLKVWVKIQGNKLRVSGHKKDSLKEVISLEKKLDLPLPLQFKIIEIRSRIYQKIFRLNNLKMAQE